MPTTSTFSPTCAAVDLSALTDNLTQFRRVLSPGCGVLAVVKANAYGHGAVEIASALIRQGVARLAVVSLEEGLALRHAGIDVPIVVLGPLFREQVDDVLAHRLTPVVSDPALLTDVARAAASLSGPYPIHIKVDTGMGRLGLTLKDLTALMTSGRFPASVHFEGLMTHLADTDGESADATERQLAQFDQAIRAVAAAGFTVPLIHAANSGGAVRFPHARFSLVRPGIMLYGYHTLPKSVPVPDLKPVLTLRSTVAQLRTLQPGQTVSYNGTFTARRPTRVAVLPIGYADGVSRRLSNCGQVLLRGRRAPIIGLVCMDMMMVDATHIADAAVGDDVVLIGRQGHERITADEVAAWLGTIPYEVLCAIGPRVPRRYHESGPAASTLSI
ncbi:alanine racemase [Nitrospira moscoviensis]|uniref:Alanine racemase n=1 Tax=Nitrospira moscoviensis TaxID=42253 RepID=A0A0K2GBC5_NITMO|nr:alanine racemase [Nitrospira moscoviensis]ALA58174.1 Alanine racemase [Nitrospira moscoviensis]